MSREIKFRAWNNSARMWQTKYSGMSCDGTKLVLMPSEYYAVNLDVDLTFVQFTGLLDKNGKEIYEGDVIDGFTVVIEPLGVGMRDSKNVWQGQLYHQSNEKEVIGNIYENSDLLK